MINRHLIRIKVLQISYAFQAKEESVERALKELKRGIEQTRELYAKLLLLPLEMKHIAERKKEAIEGRLTNTENTSINYSKYIDNCFLPLIEDCKELHTFCRNQKISWDTQDDFLLALFNQLQGADFFQQYLDDEGDGFVTARRVIYDFYAMLLLDNELFYDSIEEQNIYWNDDMWLILPLVAQDIKHTKKNSTAFTFPPLYKRSADAKFAEDLLMKSIRLSERNRELIQSVTTNWEYERIALVDRLLLGLAITELMDFEDIPVKVTLNEYVEISKIYSTENSSIFINGILDKIAKEKDVQKLKKGTGLIGGI